MKINKELSRLAIIIASVSQLGLLVIKMLKPTGFSIWVTLLPAICAALVAIILIVFTLVSVMIKTQKNYKKSVITTPKTEAEIERGRNTPAEFTSYIYLNGKEKIETRRIVHEDNRKAVVDKKYEIRNSKKILLSSTETILDE